MKEYEVTFIKIHRYRIKANSIEEAENKAIEVDSDKENDIAWVTDPVDEIEIEELGEVKE
jgi:hypothetical protein